MSVSKIAMVSGVFLFVIIAGEWLMMQSHDNKGEIGLLGVAGSVTTLAINQ
jgi:hypothetical protein